MKFYFSILIFCIMHVILSGIGIAFPSPDEVRALYLSVEHLFNQKKIGELKPILKTTHANGIVIDFKDSKEFPQDYMKNLVQELKNMGVYTIARIVVFQDSGFAQKHPETAIRTSLGAFWHSGRAFWKRYWVDPASSLVQKYNIAVAKRAIDAGFHEIQFDYIRFPTDGNMQDIRYPFFNPQESKRLVMEKFFKTMRNELKTYQPNILLAIDLFGEVFLYGKEAGIGQDLADTAAYFDVLSPMAYPSHYRCREFGVEDPTAHPYRVYFETLRRGKQYLGNHSVIIRPWIQDFTIPSIYRCGPEVSYTPDRVREQIRAASDNGIKGFMLWNVRNNFSTDVFGKK